MLQNDARDFDASQRFGPDPFFWTRYASFATQRPSTAGISTEKVIARLTPDLLGTSPYPCLGPEGTESSLKVLTHSDEVRLLDFARVTTVPSRRSGRTAVKSR